jgi:hypothetical protein
MDNITDEMIISMMDKMTEFNVLTLDRDDISKFEFLGFNPKEFLRALLSHQARQGIPAKALESDIVQMIILYVMVGNPNDTNMARRSEAAQADFKTLKNKYGLTQAGKKLKSNVFTIPRFAATFSILTMRIAKIIGPREFPGPFGSVTLPWFLKVPVFPSIIPRKTPDGIRIMLIMASAAFSSDMSMVISRFTNPSVEDIFASQYSFANNAFNSTFPSEDSRIAYISTLPIADYFQEIRDTVKKALKLSGSALQIEFPPLALIRSSLPYNEPIEPEAHSFPESSNSRNKRFESSSKGKKPEGEGIFNAPSKSPNDFESSSEEEDDSEAEMSTKGKNKGKESEVSPQTPPRASVLYYPAGLNAKKKKAFRQAERAKGFGGQFIDLPAGASMSV